MTDIELERRLADAEHTTDRLYLHVLMLSGISLVAVMLFITSFLWGVV